MGQTASTAIEIRIEGLHKAFGTHQVLRGVDLTIGRGEVVALVGGSGCGKTVLIRHVLGLLSPDQGRVLVADHGRTDAPLVDLADLGEAAIDRIHTHWGVVFQSNALFSGSVLDNLGLWLAEVGGLDDEQIGAVARRVLEAVSLPTDADFLDTDVGSLSGGMAKRLAVARALAMDPRVIFYDEPTTGLDPTSAQQIQDLLLATHTRTGGSERQARTRTTIVITHDKDLLTRLRPRIVMLHEGKVHFDGPFAAFAASASAIIRPYFDLMEVLHQRPEG